MAIRRRRHKHGREGRKKHTDELSAMLAPLEETKKFQESPQSEGKRGASDDTIRVGSSSVKMPEQLIEEDRDAASVFRLEPVAVFLLVLFLAFVAFIAWQITLMPPK